MQLGEEPGASVGQSGHAGLNHIEHDSGGAGWQNLFEGPQGFLGIPPPPDAGNDATPPLFYLAHRGEVKDNVAAISSILTSGGIPHFFDQTSLLNGVPKNDQMRLGLHTCSVGVLFLSEDFCNSPYCVAEANTLIDRYNAGDIQLRVFYESSGLAANFRFHGLSSHTSVRRARGSSTSDWILDSVLPVLAEDVAHHLGEEVRANLGSRDDWYSSICTSEWISLLSEVPMFSRYSARLFAEWIPQPITPHRFLLVFLCFLPLLAIALAILPTHTHIHAHAAHNPVAQTLPSPAPPPPLPLSLPFKPLSSVPPTDRYVEHAEYGKVVADLVETREWPVVVEICGDPGAGKSTLAKALLRDPSILTAFNTLFLKESELRPLDSYPDLPPGAPLLVVLDDVWSRQSVDDTVSALDSRVATAVVVTSRVCGLVPRSHSRVHLHGLDHNGAMRLFSWWALDDAAPEALAAHSQSTVLTWMVNYCGGIPACLEGLGSLVASSASWQDWRGIRDALAHYNQGSLEPVRTSSLFTSFEMSVEVLPPTHYSCFHALGSVVWTSDSFSTLGPRAWLSSFVWERAPSGSVHINALAFVCESLAGRPPNGTNYHEVITWFVRVSLLERTEVGAPYLRMHTWAVNRVRERQGWANKDSSLLEDTRTKLVSAYCARFCSWISWKQRPEFAMHFFEHLFDYSAKAQAAAGLMATQVVGNPAMLIALPMVGLLSLLPQAWQLCLRWVGVDGVLILVVGFLYSFGKGASAFFRGGTSFEDQVFKFGFIVCVGFLVGSALWSVDGYLADTSWVWDQIRLPAAVLLVTDRSGFVGVPLAQWAMAYAGWMITDWVLIPYTVVIFSALLCVNTAASLYVHRYVHALVAVLCGGGWTVQLVMRIRQTMPLLSLLLRDPMCILLVFGFCVKVWLLFLFGVRPASDEEMDRVGIRRAYLVFLGCFLVWFVCVALGGASEYFDPWLGGIWQEMSFPIVLLLTIFTQWHFPTLALTRLIHMLPAPPGVVVPLKLVLVVATCLGLDMVFAKMVKSLHSGAWTTFITRFTPLWVATLFFAYHTFGSGNWMLATLVPIRTVFASCTHAYEFDRQRRQNFLQ